MLLALCLSKKAPGASSLVSLSQWANTTLDPRLTTQRPRGESAEEKKERKHAVKAARQERRVEKKEKKEEFSAAVRQRTQELARTVAIERKL
jgi:hypothetical protein